jgi:hypothetical protein
MSAVFQVRQGCRDSTCFVVAGVQGQPAPARDAIKILEDQIAISH